METIISIDVICTLGWCYGVKQLWKEIRELYNRTEVIKNSVERMKEEQSSVSRKLYEEIDKIYETEYYVTEEINDQIDL